MRQNRQVSLLLSQIGDLLEIKGGDFFKIRAYRRAARAVASAEEEISSLASESRLMELPGIGKALAAKIEEILRTGTCNYLEELKREIPIGVIDLTYIPGVGAKTALALYRELNLESIEELEASAKSGRLRTVAGLGEKKERVILEGISSLRRSLQKTLIGLARPLGIEILEEVKASGLVKDAVIVGEVRRWVEAVSDLEILVCPDESHDSLDLVKWLMGTGCDPSESPDFAEGVYQVKWYLEGPLQCRFHVVKPDAWPFALLWFTGSEAHVKRMRALAKEKGLELTPSGLFLDSGERITLTSESEIYQALNMQAVPPELREDRGEIEASLKQALPDLIQLSHIAGDIHVHTTWTDGTEDIETMARACIRSGYQYMAVCDHSISLKVAGGLDESDLRRQMQAIRSLNELLGETNPEFRILAGVEANLLPDGELDLPDQLLENLDLVIASVHSGLRQGRAEMTKRLVRAARHPLVDIIGHPTCRLIGRRSACDLDLEQVVQAAVMTGTALEINSSYDRLDLNDKNAKMALDMGARFAISTDAHSEAGLSDIGYGVAIARRAWLERSRVLNAAPLEEMLSSLKRITTAS